MATGKEYLAYVLDQLSLLDGISHRAMMGEYIIYYNDKVAAELCDNRFLVKIVPSSGSHPIPARRICFLWKMWTTGSS